MHTPYTKFKWYFKLKTLSLPATQNQVSGKLFLNCQKARRPKSFWKLLLNHALPCIFSVVES